MATHCLVLRVSIDLKGKHQIGRFPKYSESGIWPNYPWRSQKQCNLIRLDKQWQQSLWTKPTYTLGPFTLAKTKIQKTWVFCCTVYTARKTHNIRGFWHEKRMREKTRISYLCFGKWCACATSLYLWPYTCSAHYVAGRGRVIPLKVTYHVTKNPNNTGEIGASVYIGKKPVKFRRSFKKSRCRGGFFDSGFLECLGEVA